MSPQNQIHENIDVIVRFDKAGVTPLIFKHVGRKIKISSIDLKYTSRSLATTFYIFHVSAGGNSYKIALNNQNLTWSLEEIYSP